MLLLLNKIKNNIALRKEVEMKKAINRIVPADKTSELAAIIMLYSLPQTFNTCDALTVLPGQGEDWRLLDAINHWNKDNIEARFLLIAGINPK